MDHEPRDLEAYRQASSSFTDPKKYEDLSVHQCRFVRNVVAARCSTPHILDQLALNELSAVVRAMNAEEEDDSVLATIARNNNTEVDTLIRLEKAILATKDGRPYFRHLKPVLAGSRRIMGQVHKHLFLFGSWQEHFALSGNIACPVNVLKLLEYLPEDIRPCRYLRVGDFDRNALIRMQVKKTRKTITNLARAAT